MKVFICLTIVSVLSIESKIFYKLQKVYEQIGYNVRLMSKMNKRQITLLRFVDIEDFKRVDFSFNISAHKYDRHLLIFEFLPARSNLHLDKIRFRSIRWYSSIRRRFVRAIIALVLNCGYCSIFILPTGRRY